MKTLVVNKAGAWLGVEQNRLAIRHENETVSSICLQRLEQVVITGQVSLDSRLLHMLGQRGIHLMFLNQGYQNPVIMLPEGAGAVTIRMSQYRCLDNAPLVNRLCQMLVRYKLHRQWLWLKATGSQQRAQAAKATVAHISGASQETLLGLEGHVARLVYQTMGDKLNANLWHFTGRNRRPPRDPVNALLSFGASLAYQHCVAILTRHRLDTSAGFYHQPCPGRLSLAWDMVELFRPDIETFIMDLITTRRMTPDLFIWPGKSIAGNTGDTADTADTDNDSDTGCRLTPEGLKIWFHYWTPEIKKLKKRMTATTAFWTKTVLQQGNNRTKMACQPLINRVEIEQKTGGTHENTV